MFKLLLFLLLSVSLINARQLSVEHYCEYDSSSKAFTAFKTIDINPDDTMTLFSGTVVHFTPFSGINVKGLLVSKGDPDDPVILTSKKSTIKSGSPYDWLGIQMFPGAACRLSFTRLSFSSYGITSCCENISLVNVTFHLNGVNIRIGDRILPVNDNKPFSLLSVSNDNGNKEEKINGNSTKTLIQINNNRYESIVNQKYIPRRTYFVGPLSMVLMIAGSVITYDNYRNPVEKEVFNSAVDRFLYCGSLGYCLTALGVLGGTYITIYTINF
jgi:hypothetical protein